MRALAKVLLWIVGAVVLVGLFCGGLGLAFWGFADQHAARYTYKIGFKKAGDSCGNNDVSVDINTGVPLGCGTQAYNEPNVDLPGFSSEQNDKVVSLSMQLGKDGFTDAERTQLQNEVDKIVASLPPERLPQHPWWWGWKMGVVGLLMMVTPIGLASYAIQRL
ncbi:hypothetical protein [Kribbella swartbergensis]